MTALDFRNDSVDRVAQDLLTCDDFFYLGVKCGDVNFLALVFLSDVSADGKVVVLSADFVGGNEPAEKIYVGAVFESADDTGNIFRREFVIIGDLDKFVGGVDEEDFAVGLVLFHDEDAGSDTGAEKQIGRELNNCVDEILVDEVLADFLFSAAAIHDAREADDSGGTARRKPGECVQDKSKVGLTFWSENAGWGETRVVNQQGIGVASPFDRVGRIGNDEFKRFVVPVRGIGERIVAGNIELVRSEVVQEHVDSAKIVSCDVNFLPEETEFDVFPAENFNGVQEQGAGAASRIVNLVDFRFVDGTEPREEFGDFSGRKELAAGLASVGGVHGHQIFVGVADSVNRVIVEIHFSNAVENFNKALVPFGDSAAELVAVYVEVIEQALETVFKNAAPGRFFNVAENFFKRLIQISVARGIPVDVDEELTGENEKALFLYKTFASFFGFRVG